ncbi:hypothetical protein FQ185_29675, partial [Pseudomonas sp. ANT_H12B]
PHAFSTRTLLLSLSTIAGTKISNPSWVIFQSAGWVSFQSAPTALPLSSCLTICRSSSSSSSGSPPRITLASPVALTDTVATPAPSTRHAISGLRPDAKYSASGESASFSTARLSSLAPRITSPI